MKEIKCTLCAIVFISLLPITSNAQVQFGVKLGRVYLINSDYYTLNTGYTASAYAYPFRKDNISLGVEVGYISKGYVEEYMFSGDTRPVEYLSLGIPLKYDIKTQGVFDLFVYTTVSYDILLQDNFKITVGTAERWNSNFAYTLGTGVLYKEAFPHFTFDLSLSRETDQFVLNEINTSLDLKLGLLFDGL